MAVCLSGSSVCLSACLPVRALNLTPFSVLFIRVPYYLGAKKGPPIWRTTLVLQSGLGLYCLS